MTKSIAAVLLLASVSLSACSGANAPPLGPAGQPSSTDVNPITGSRGGSATSR